MVWLPVSFSGLFLALSRPQFPHLHNQKLFSQLWPIAVVVGCPEPWCAGSWKGAGPAPQGQAGHGEGSRRIIGQVQEEADVPHGSILLEVRLEEPGCLHVHLYTQQGRLEVESYGLSVGPVPSELSSGKSVDWLTVTEANSP